MSEFSPTPASRSRRVASRAFTLVELLVATALLLTLMFIVGTALQQTNQVVSLTVANQDVATHAAGIAAQMRDDFRRMRGDGYLVIKSKTTTTLIQTPGSSKDPSRPYNIDQIMFFATGPFTSQRYLSGDYKRTITGDTARIWYGHLSGNINSGLGAGIAFQPCYGASGDLISAHKWILGRHALVITNKSGSDTVANGGLGITGTNCPPTNLWQHKNYAPGGDTYRGILYGEWDFLVDESGATSPFTSNSLPSIMAQAYQTTSPNGYDASGLLLSAPGYAYAGGWGGNSSISARNDAMAEACFRVYGKRTISDVGTTDLRVASQLVSNVAAPYCSEFMVEFAGDYVGGQDGAIDYESLPSHNGDPTNTVSNDIYWYGSVNVTTYAGAFPNKIGRRRYIDNTIYGAANAPSATRPINYYVYDDANALSAHQPYTAVFSPDRNATPWPKLIRITMTVHDDAGRLHDRYVKSTLTADPLPAMKDGRTFQYVFEVP